MKIRGKCRTQFRKEKKKNNEPKIHTAEGSYSAQMDFFSSSSSIFKSPSEWRFSWRSCPTKLLVILVIFTKHPILIECKFQYSLRGALKLEKHVRVNFRTKKKDFIFCWSGSLLVESKRTWGFPPNWIEPYMPQRHPLKNLAPYAAQKPASHQDKAACWEEEGEEEKMPESNLHSSRMVSLEVWTLLKNKTLFDFGR